MRPALTTPTESATFPHVRHEPCTGRVLNAMTIDVEDYFQVSAFEDQIPRSEWSSHESRVCRNTARLLELLALANTRATFFVLGWIGERYQSLLREIADAGHELASHGFDHRLVYRLGPAGFREDLRRAKDAIESATGCRVLGYRAPSFSITSDSLWALDVLIEEGYAYDASIYPIRHDRYGIPTWPRHPGRVARRGGSLWEVPASTVRITGVNVPIGGGGYFRLLPYGWTKRGMERVNLTEGRPVVFYVHPWEIDPGQPRMRRCSAFTRVRHYTNLSETEARLRRLLQDFSFGPINAVLSLGD